MITYELAKQLKDAWFPHSEEWIDSGSNFWVEKGELSYLVPTLSELIGTLPPRIIWKNNKPSFEPSLEEEWEELDEDYKLLWFSLDAVSESGGKDGWSACYADDNISYIDFEAKTPEEAVAKLWLELMK